jgi:HK97 gp10 family phage protein
MNTILHGLPQTKTALEKAKREIELAAPSAAKAGGEAVARAAASRAPRRTGRLAASIRVETTTLGDGATASVGTDVSYARFPEFGTVYMPGQHFLSDGAKAAEREIVAAAIAVFKSAIT